MSVQLTAGSITNAENIVDYTESYATPPDKVPAPTLNNLIETMFPRAGACTLVTNHCVCGDSYYEP